jgi:hypothetical protein
LARAMVGTTGSRRFPPSEPASRPSADGARIVVTSSLPHPAGFVRANPQREALDLFDRVTSIEDRARGSERVGNLLRRPQTLCTRWAERAARRSSFSDAPSPRSAVSNRYSHLPEASRDGALALPANRRGRLHRSRTGLESVIGELDAPELEASLLSLPACFWLVGFDRDRKVFASVRRSTLRPALRPKTVSERAQTKLRAAHPFASEPTAGRLCSMGALVRSVAISPRSSPRGDASARGRPADRPSLRIRRLFFRRDARSEQDASLRLQQTTGAPCTR